MKPYYQTDDVTIYHGDCREVLPTLEAQSVQCCVTSPPYWGLRSYLDDHHPDKQDELGLESTPDCELRGMVKLRSDLSSDQQRRVALWLRGEERPDE